MGGDNSLNLHQNSNCMQELWLIISLTMNPISKFISGVDSVSIRMFGIFSERHWDTRLQGQEGQVGGGGGVHQASMTGMLRLKTFYISYLAYLSAAA